MGVAYGKDTGDCEYSLWDVCWRWWSQHMGRVLELMSIPYGMDAGYCEYCIWDVCWRCWVLPTGWMLQVSGVAYRMDANGNEHSIWDVGERGKHVGFTRIYQNILVPCLTSHYNKYRSTILAMRAGYYAYCSNYYIPETLITRRSTSASKLLMLMPKRMSCQMSEA